MVVLSQNKIHLITQQLEQLICCTAGNPSRIDDFYVFSYPALLAGAERHVTPGDWSVNEVTRRLTMVYGWMPCSPKSHNEAAIAELAALLNAQRDLATIIPVAARCFANSLVAGSKFMHCERPHEAPMFDSNLEALFWPETRSRLSYPSTAVRRYLEWTVAIHAVRPDLKAKARRWALEAFGYEVSEVRAVEAIAFYAASGSTRPGASHFPGSVA
ncbi:hypothetical protein [Burkholderia cenocepacia]|uniref:hypothetical protein n=1 Tax=Burkholderia cenocepacia TaxID=95486 RepID=UPI0007611EB6|nr:hypothetical protein [Burkholderia cenocepacia]KWU26332.1 hypothetical protein AS149_25420 [Burkholderia cenocepacia]